MSDSLLLGFESKKVLSTWLRGQERPHLISRERWVLFLKGDLTSISFDEMADLCDCFGPGILDLLLWPNRPRGIHRSIKRSITC